MLDDLKAEKLRPLKWMEQLKTECRANNIVIPGADFSQFEAQIHYFQGFATRKETSKAEQEIASGQSAYNR